MTTHLAIKKYPKTTEEHAEFGPSSLEQYAQCPCFTPREDQEWTDSDGEVTESPAEIGTRIHKALETQDPFLCKDGYERWMYNACLQGVDELMEATGFSKTNKRFLYLTDELRLDPILIGDSYRIFGTVDKMIVRTERGAGKSALVIDYKTGKTPVSPTASNYQAVAYSLGVFQHNPEITKIHFAFVQPSINNTPSTTLHTFQRKDIWIMETAILAVINQAKAKVTRQVSLKCCPYCSQSGTCPALRQSALMLVKKVDPSAISLLGDLEDPEYLKSPEVLETLLDAAKTLSGAFEAWTKIAKEKIISEGLDNIGSYYLSARGTAKTLNKEEFLKSIDGKTAAEYVELFGTPSMKKVSEAFPDEPCLFDRADAPESSRKLLKKK